MYWFSSSARGRFLEGRGRREEGRRKREKGKATEQLNYTPENGQLYLGGALIFDR